VKYTAEAPSNIALIKYMGKLDSSSNRPTNASVSFTLEHLRTRVEIEALKESADDRWEPLKAEGFEPLNLSEKASSRFLTHFQFLKRTLKIPGSYLVRSANTFPSDCGLASSASSFAALTRAAVELGKDASVEKEWVEALTPSEQAELSRQGSGSSCRSFFSPFGLWTERGVEVLDLPRSRWLHSVVVVEAGKKEVSSSEAHRRVSESLLFQGRPDRAETRLARLMESLKSQNWRESFEICWAEFWDMHALFETCEPAFGYMQPASLEVLKEIREGWRQEGDGPLVTMDAGANLHLLYREDQSQRARADRRRFSSRYKVISSFGTGDEKL
jgi:diphosphomevalonate decarboxylase